MTVIEYIIDEFEGGKLGGPYTDDKTDRGGATRWGITQATASAYYGSKLPKSFISEMPLRKAVEIGTRVFVDATNYAGIIDWRLRLIVVDFGFNFGFDDSTPALQRALGAKPDGQCGPITLAMANDPKTDALAICVKVIAARQFLHVQQSYKPLQITNIRGWINRTSTLLNRITWGEGLT